MAKDVCIKSGSFCPVHKGITLCDCWHEAHEFQSGSFRFDRLETQLHNLVKAVAPLIRHGRLGIDAVDVDAIERAYLAAKS